MNGPDSQAGEYITIREAAALLRCDPKTIRRYIKAGRLTVAQRGQAHNDPLLVELEAVKRLIAEDNAQDGAVRRGDELTQALSIWTRDTLAHGQKAWTGVQAEARKTRYFVLGVVIVAAGIGAWTVHRQGLDSQKNVQAVSRGVSEAKIEAQKAGTMAQEAAGGITAAREEIEGLRGMVGQLQAQVSTLQGQIRDMARTPSPSPAITPEAPRAPSPGPARTPAAEEESGGFLGIF